MQTFGEHLRRWRGERRLSQLALASQVETSTRHLSFLESGRSTPKREMVLRLADALMLAPHERDRALESAGLQPDRRQAPPDGPDLVILERAVETLLANHDPLPAYAMDIDWRLLDINAGGARLLSAMGLPSSANTEITSGPSTLLDLLIAHVDSGSIVNWIEVTGLAVARARAELVRRSEPSTDFLAALDQLEALHVERVRAQAERTPPIVNAPAVHNSSSSINGTTTGTVTTKVTVPLRVHVGEVTLSLISMVAQFGGIDYLDVDAPRVELMFPEDSVTAEWFQKSC